MSDAVASVIIAGHSHIAALGVPIKGGTESFKQVKLSNGSEKFMGLTGNWPRDSGYWGELTRLVSGPQRLALSWQGNQYLTRFMFSPTPKFDFVLSERPDLPLDSSHVIVPEQALHQLYRNTLNELAALLKRLPSEALGNLVLLGSPPPKEDDAHCRKYLEKEPGYGRIAASLGFSLDTVELSPALMRYKHWAVLQKVVKKLAAEFSVDFIPAPVEAQSEQGFLKRNLWAEDATHANSAYGELVLGAISAWVDSKKS